MFYCRKSHFCWIRGPISNVIFSRESNAPTVNPIGKCISLSVKTNFNITRTSYTYICSLFENYIAPAQNRSLELHSISIACADPGIFVRGGGVQVSLIKNNLTRFFFFFFFFFFISPQLILQKSNGQFRRNLSFFKDPQGVQYFPGGVQLFLGGSNCSFLIETNVICDFPRGVRTPCPLPHWIRTCIALAFSFCLPYGAFQGGKRQENQREHVLYGLCALHCIHGTLKPQNRTITLATTIN